VKTGKGVRRQFRVKHNIEKKQRQVKTKELVGVLSNWKSKETALGG